MVYKFRVLDGNEIELDEDDLIEHVKISKREEPSFQPDVTFGSESSSNVEVKAYQIQFVHSICLEEFAAFFEYYSKAKSVLRFVTERQEIGPFWAKFALSLQCSNSKFNWSQQKKVISIQLECHDGSLPEEGVGFTATMTLGNEDPVIETESSKWPIGKTDVSLSSDELGVNVDRHLEQNGSLRIHVGIGVRVSVFTVTDKHGVVVETAPKPGNRRGIDATQLLGNPMFSDLDLICQGQTIKAHKVVLALKSDVFKEKLKVRQFN